MHRVRIEPRQGAKHFRHGLGGQLMFKKTIFRMILQSCHKNIAGKGFIDGLNHAAADFVRDVFKNRNAGHMGNLRIVLK